MSTYKLPISVEDAVITSVGNLYSAIREGKLDAATNLKEYIENSKLEDIQETIAKAASPRLSGYLEALVNGYETMNLLELQEELRTESQGIYAGIVTKGDTTNVYIGSAYGVRGLENRVFNNHLSSKSRQREPQKALYKAMDSPGAKTAFVLLVKFEEHMDTSLVLFAEATCVSLFGSLRSRIYRDLRLEELPLISWSFGLNRSNPLVEDGSQTIGTESATYRRLKILDNCRRSGPVKVRVTPMGQGASNQDRFLFTFNLCAIQFNIPPKIGIEWKLLDDPVVNVQWDVSKNQPEHPFTAEAEATDDGSRLGVRIFKDINGQPHEYWLSRKGPTSVPLANALVDFLEGKIVGKPYEWLPSRRYLFRSYDDQEESCLEVEIFCNLAIWEAKSRPKRKRIGLDYDDSEFVWGDLDRPKETKPAKMQRKANTKDCGDKRGQQEDEDDDDDDDDEEDWRERKVLPKEPEEPVDIESFQRWVREMDKKYMEPHYNDLRRRGTRVWGRLRPTDS